MNKVILIIITIACILWFIPVWFDFDQNKLIRYGVLVTFLVGVFGVIVGFLFMKGVLKK